MSVDTPGGPRTVHGSDVVDDDTQVCQRARLYSILCRTKGKRHPLDGEANVLAICCPSAAPTSVLAAANATACSWPRASYLFAVRRDPGRHRVSGRVLQGWNGGEYRRKDLI
jgi:hypothetical protein